MTRIINKIAFFKRIFISLIISLALFGCNNSSNQTNPKIQASVLTVETFRINGGWGYNILAGKKIIIKQDIIPGIQNNMPFQSEADAKKVGILVMGKISKHLHPAIKTEELDSLKISY